MLVYRVCRKDEIDKIFSDYNYTEIGSFCKTDDKNNHKYESNKKYMHFFPRKENILYLNSLNGRYICTYNISEYLLNNHKGICKYLDFITFKHLQLIDEYAIPSELIEFVYFERVDAIKFSIDYEDFLDNYNLDGLIQNIYIKNKKIKILK